MARKFRSDFGDEKEKKNKSSQKPKSTNKNRNGTRLTKPDYFKRRWKEYVKDLYATDDKTKFINIESKNAIAFNCFDQM